MVVFVYAPHASPSPIMGSKSTPPVKIFFQILKLKSMEAIKSYESMSYKELKELLGVSSITFQPSEDKNWFGAFISKIRANVYFHKDLLSKVEDSTVFLIRIMNRISKQSGKPFTDYAICEIKLKEGSVTR